MDETTKQKLVEIINKNERLQEYGLDEDYAQDFVETADTVEDFKTGAHSWANDRSCPVDANDGVYHLQNHQYVKGDERNDLFIIDLGDKRYAYKFKG